MGQLHYNRHDRMLRLDTVNRTDMLGHFRWNNYTTVDGTVTVGYNRQDS